MVLRARRQYDLFLATYLLCVSTAIYYIFSLGLRDTTQAGDTISYRLVWLVLYVTLILKIAKRADIIGPMLLKSGLLILFVLSAIVSAIINVIDVQSQIKFAMYLMTIAGAAWLTSLNSVDRVLSVFFRVAMLVSVIHVLSYIIIGNVVETDERLTILGTVAYQGLFPHKNAAASFFGLSALVCLARVLSPGRVSRGRYVLAMILQLLMMAWAGAATALLSVVVAMATTFSITNFRYRRSYFGLILLIAAAIAIPAIIGLSEIFKLVGREASLTGRIDLWSAWPHFVFERPLFGYGYANFFSERPDSPAWELWSTLPWGMRLPSFHNSYLQAAIDFGIVGSLFFYLILAKAMWTAFRFAFHSRSIYAAAPLAMIVFSLTGALVESSLSMHNYVHCVLVFWLYFGIELPFSNRVAGSQSLTRAHRWHWSERRLSQYQPWLACDLGRADCTGDEGMKEGRPVILR